MCGEIGLFCGDIELICDDTGLFCRYTYTDKAPSVFFREYELRLVATLLAGMCNARQCVAVR